MINDEYVFTIHVTLIIRKHVKSNRYDMFQLNQGNRPWCMLFSKYVESKHFQDLLTSRKSDWLRYEDFINTDSFNKLEEEYRDLFLKYSSLCDFRYVAEDSKGYSAERNINKRDTETAEVFTPPWLVNEMLDALPKEVFTDPLKTFLDPSCGDGNFLVAVLQRKIDQGSNVLQALHTTYGVELMPDNVQECKRRLRDIALANLPDYQKIDKVLLVIDKVLDHNIVCADSLTWDYESWQPLPMRSRKDKT